MGSTWWESYGCSSEPAAPYTNTAAPAGGKEKKWVMCIPLNSALSDGQRHRKAKYDIVDYHGNASRAGRFERDSKVHL